LFYWQKMPPSEKKPPGNIQRRKWSKKLYNNKEVPLPCNPYHCNQYYPPSDGEIGEIKLEETLNLGKYWHRSKEGSRLVSQATRKPLSNRQSACSSPRGSAVANHVTPSFFIPENLASLSNKPPSSSLGTTPTLDLFLLHSIRIIKHQTTSVLKLIPRLPWKLRNEPLSISIMFSGEDSAVSNGLRKWKVNK